MRPVLEVRNLVTRFDTRHGVVNAVNGISYSVDEGRVLAIVGESGSGKSVSALSLMGLVPCPPGRIESGEVVLNGRDVLSLSPSALNDVRGREIAMVFQDPTSSLNPVLSVGYQIAEAIDRHTPAGRTASYDKVGDLLERVGIPDARQRAADYPHEFSGGQRQRIMIAMALAAGPSVLIADEPTTALDVTVQAQIVELIAELRAELGMAVIWISHDLALVASFADEVAVMYAGYVVERAPVGAIYRRPRHPYTLGLQRAMPRLDEPARARLQAIDGRPPDMRQSFASCPFAARCPWAIDQCMEERPELEPVAGEEHFAACWRSEELPTLVSREAR